MCLSLVSGLVGPNQGTYIALWLSFRMIMLYRQVVPVITNFISDLIGRDLRVHSFTQCVVSYFSNSLIRYLIYWDSF